ncbi:pentapeptide repeat-containing protein [Desulfovibrio sp. JC022]|uniref:pentapeptide repeat-containing protein n=1 Tax=Desulfovibrio sp. JC022 TaxID=2593642 RepID=UPI0013D18AA8|nr:pentapeptide repeat-containing protein [Desulfovibrio sp. JC022]NDV22303.1 pentapeptide repeat-containing protein [Desulfovibrio sp. JC022]
MVLVSDGKILACRPRSLRSRAGEQFLSSLKKSVIDIAAATASLSPKDIKDAISGMYSNVVAVNLEEAVWLLFNRSLAKTVNDIFSDIVQRSEKMSHIVVDAEFIADILIQLEVDSFEVDPEFVDNLGSTPWVILSAGKIVEWAREHGCSKENSSWLKSAICNLMPKHMRNELLVNKDDYTIIHRETIFDAAVKRSLDWNAYHSSIRLEVSAPIFDTAVPLKNIYVFPRASSYWVTKNFHPAGQPSSLLSAEKFRVMRESFKRSECLDLHKSLHEWLDILPNLGNYQDRMRIVCGSPGCGKSSFATVFANEVIDRGGRVLLVRLGRIGHFDETKSLEDVLTHYFVNRLKVFRQSPFLGYNSSCQLTLILDGLDELAGPMEQGKDASHSFIKAALNMLQDHSYGGNDLAIILTGRKLLFPVYEAVGGYKLPSLLMQPFVIDEEDRDSFYHVTQHQIIDSFSENEFKRWLDFLRYKRLIETPDDFEPYYPPEKEDDFWLDKFTELGLGDLYEELLTQSLLVRRDDRDLWWKKWGQLHNLTIEGTPSEITGNPELNLITSEPLLNFLAAQLVDDGTVEIGDDFTANLLYEKVLGKIFEREDDKSHFFFDRLQLDKDSFFKLLEQIAATGWRHGNEKRVARKLLTTKLSKLVGRLAEEDAGITRLLLLFYFSSSYHEDEECIEFTHRTFAEYLLARAFAREAKDIHHRYHKRWENGEKDVGLTTLLEWTEFCGGGELSFKIHTLLVEEISRLGDRDFVAEIQETLRTVFELALNDGFPVHLQTAKDPVQSEVCFRPSNLSFKEMEYRSECAEINLLGVLNACARYTGKRYEVSFGSGLDSSANWMRKHAGLVSVGNDGEMGVTVGGSVQSNRILGRCCSHMNLMEQNFTAQDFCFMDLNNCSFVRSELSLAQLRGASMEGADLRSVSMEGGNGHQLICAGADLTDAVMTECYLFDANFDAAVCVNANLSGSALAGASFRGANLAGTKFRYADLDYVDFSGATLTNAVFTGASYENAIFDDDHLDDVIFEDDEEGDNLE